MSLIDYKRVYVLRWCSNCQWYFVFLKCRLLRMIQKFKTFDLHLLWDIFLKYKQNWYYPVVLDCRICHWRDKTLVNKFMKRKQNPITYWFLSCFIKKKEKSSHLSQLMSDRHPSNATNMSAPDCIFPTSSAHHRPTWGSRNSQHIQGINGVHRGCCGAEAKFSLGSSVQCLD